MLEQLVRRKKNTNEIKNFKSLEMLLEGAIELMSAILDTEKQEFRLFTPNVLKIEENCFAKLYYCAKQHQYVLKSRYCLKCSATPSYFCDRDPSGRAWPFQQEIANFKIVSSTTIDSSRIKNGSQRKSY